MAVLSMMCSCYSLSNEGRVIVMSIHQPRYSIFRLCDHITLMSRGNIVYTGAGRATLPYFADVLGKILSLCLCMCVYLHVVVNQYNCVGTTILSS